MATPYWAKAVLRSLVWLGATAFLAYLKKPDGASFAAVREDWIGWLGVGLLVAGLGLHFWSNLSLAWGEYESRQGVETLVVRGPYRYVRHPTYLAGVPLLFGVCLLYPPLRMADLIAGSVPRRC